MDAKIALFAHFYAQIANKYEKRINRTLFTGDVNAGAHYR